MPAAPRAALESLRVVDLTDLRGALAGRMLAELGADVIKVEPPDGDPGRLRPPFAGGVPAPDRSLSFLSRNAGKRGAVIDLEDEAGRRRFGDLCSAADVLIENLGAREQARLQLTPLEVRARHPHLIHLTIADLGLSGPRAGWRLEPLTAFAASGALHASGFPDRPPSWLPGYLAHDCASIYGVVGVLAALIDLAVHGAGQTVEVSVQEAALNGLDPWSIPLADYARLFPMFPASVPRDADGVYFVLPTRDGFVRAVVGTPRQAAALGRLLWGDPGAPSGRNSEPLDRARPAESSDDVPFAAHAAMWLDSLPWRVLALASGVAIGVSRLLPLPGLTLSLTQSLVGTARSLLAHALRARPRDEVLAAALRLGVPMAPVNTPEEFVAAEQTRARGYFRKTGFPHLGDAPFAAAPWRLSVTPAGIRRPAPAPGEDDGTWLESRREHVVTAAGAASADRAALRPALAGLRVINLGIAAVGPEMCWLLGELGAEVIKIESGQHVDLLRSLTPDLANPNTSFPFNDDGRGQKSVCLDLHTPLGRELALGLCANADIVVENHRGGTVRAWGLDYPEVKALRPDVIYVSSQGYGCDGPLGEAPSFGPVNNAFAGATWLWSDAEAPYPAGSSLNHPDHIASKLGVVAVLAALEHRRRTGEGQLVEMAQTEATAYLMAEFYLEHALTGRPTRQPGNDADYACPHGVYPCTGDDRWCAIAVVGEAAWERFERAVGWSREPALATLEARRAARRWLDARVAEWTRERTPEEVAGILQAAGVSAMPVQGPEEHRSDPHLAARHALVTVVHPDVGGARYTANPLRMSRTPMSPVARAPRLGEHTADVLTRVLGLTESEVESLVARGVCR
ncbi:MAG TPA: CoA transferase [Candidatus Binatia bacterium]|nr:CoA transferase [Candidatus Binatia bacterium]